MTPRLKPLSEQVIVLTGATSGIGLATVRAAADAGAKLVLVARNEDALNKLVEELRGRGTEAVACPGDVADPATAERAAALAEERFGGFDSWVNNAGAFIYGRIDEVPLEDQRRLFDVVYWGVVHGSLAAMKRFADRPGSLVNIGSVLSERAMALQGPYSAAKFAVKAFTDALRVEAMMAQSMASITLVKPGPIDTPYVEHTRNLLDSPGTRVPPPSYHPRVVARAILHACTTPVRDLTVGGGGAAIAWMGKIAPGLTDLAMAALAKPMQTTDEPGRPEFRDNLYEPRADLAETSSLPGPQARRTSLLLEAQMNPVAVLAAGAAGAATLLLLRQRRRGPGRDAMRRAPGAMKDAAPVRYQRS